MNFRDQKLPILESIDQILASLARTGRVVIAAPPGAGKTTLVPPAACEAFADGQKVLVLQPRKMAARSVAARLAKLMGTPVGEGVGYQVRMDRRWGEQSKIVVMTYGVLLRRLQIDPLLEGFGTVFLDEFHERSIEADLALGMLVRVRKVLRDDLKIGVMSATLDVGPIAGFLDDAPVIKSEGRTFPLQIRYIDKFTRDRLEDMIAEVLPKILRETQGHILVFLPGVGEIRRVGRKITGMQDLRGAEILELYGDLSPDRQDAVISDSNKRKVILSTNVAETSITVPGVTGVIDSGLARVMRVNSTVGLPRLDVEPISQASADQRAGRAGRTSPGICYRLWMKATDRSRPEFNSPEVLRGDLSGAVLQLYGWGESDIASFPWLTPPRNESIDSALLLLERLGAITNDKITDLGKQLLEVPAHPRIARMLLAGRDNGIARRAAVCAAMLTERDPFIDKNTANRLSKGDIALLGLDSDDVLSRAARLECWMDGQEDTAIHVPAAKATVRVAQQFFDLVSDYAAGNEKFSEDEIDERLARALLDAFPDRLAKLRLPNRDRGVMVGGTGVRFQTRASSDNSLQLCIELLHKATEADVRLATAIREDWLRPPLLQFRDEQYFHPSQYRVVARRRSYWLDLMLSEQPIEVVDLHQASTLLAEEVKGRWNRVFPADNKEIVQWIARVGTLNRLIPELGLPDPDEQWLVDIATEICVGKQSLEEVRQAPWLDYIKAKIGFDLAQKIETFLPEKIKLPSGNLATVDYSEPDQPSLGVRLQELFGWFETPRIAGGRLPLLLRIQGPNYREIQVTRDLGNFWRSTYHDVRKELRRRYPKHHWPEDPLTASATKSGLGRHAKPD